MKTVLLVIESEEFGQRVRKELQRDHEVLLCHDTASAAQLMDPQPDAMVLQLELPGMDGLTFLEHLPCRPSVILTLAVNYPPYTAQRLYDLGVGHFVRTPCTLAAVADRLRDMLRTQDYSHDDPQSAAASHLSILGIPSDERGGKHLRIGIPLYAQDPGQKLSMELYPTIAKICGTSTGGAVEHAIREAIQKAWDQREESWTDYFPHRRRCPSNKVFISTLAEKLY